MSRRFHYLAFALLAGCLNVATITSSPDAAEAGFADANPNDRDAGLDTGAVSVDASRSDSGIATLPNGPLCPAVPCATGQACCFGTGLCYDPATPAACLTPSRAVDPRACSSNAQCAATEVCDYAAASARCLGVGSCQPRRPPSDCGSMPAVCGCDGQTWPDLCAASRAGVRVAGDQACGQWVYPSPGNINECISTENCSPGFSCDLTAHHCVPDRPIVTCALDSQCPSGKFCCPYTGLCVSSSDRALCRTFPSERSNVGCRTNADCLDLHYYSPVQANYYCAGDGCDAVGSCTELPRGCTGELAPVCGCDGHAYTNACAANAAATRVAHTGACP